MSWPEACVKVAGYFLGGIAVLGGVTVLTGLMAAMTAEDIIRAWRGEK